MVSLADLWLPILLSAVLVFVASSLIHMVLGWHRHDFKKLAAEDAVMDALRPFNLGPGNYVAPWAALLVDDLGRRELDAAQPRRMVHLFPRRRDLRRLRRRAVAVGRCGLYDGVPRDEHGRVRGFCARDLAELDLVFAQLGLHDSIDDRRSRLCTVDGRRVRLALAVSSVTRS